MESKNAFRTLVRGASQLVVISSGKKVKRGAEMDTVDVIENGSMVIGNDGSIVAVGPDADIAAQYGSASFDTIIDAKGKAVLPGLVDGHTHPVWSGDRVHEFAMKLAGATYMDIHKMGGGIGFTVRHVHESSEDELLALLLARLDRMLKFGTTVIDAKSGYGLDTANELKLLRVLHKAKGIHPIDLVCNYCGGHSVPKGSTAAQATADIVNNQIPALVASNQRGETSAELIDVFMEKGVFEAADTRAILEAGKKVGLHANFHGDELSYTAAAELAGDIGAMAVSHLEWVSDDGIKKMAERDVAAVLLPTTAYILRVHPPPARKMIENNVIVALGSDFNPNAHCMSLPMVMNLACVLMRMTMKEALNACTINAAASVNRSASHGTLEAGKQGDFLILNAPNWEHLIYQIVDPPIEAVYRKGKLVYSAPSTVRQSA